MDGLKMFSNLLLSKIKKEYIPQELTTQIYQTITTGTNHIEGCTSTAQNEIGWHRLLQGNFSNDWLKFLSYLPGNISGQKYISEIICAIWKVWHMAWNIRNESIDPTARYKEQMIRDNMVCELEVIYTNRKLLSPQMSRQLEPTLQDHMIQSKTKILNWLELHRIQCKKEINKIHPNKWETTRQEIITRELATNQDPN